MRHGVVTLTLAVALAGAALAHTGVQNAAVLARMDAMKGIGEATKVLGQMAKGGVPFDADAARAAAARIAVHAAETPALFEARETDPKSEALPAIWDSFDDFTAKSIALETLAAGLATSIATPQDLTAGMAALGASCKACHSEYRQ